MTESAALFKGIRTVIYAVDDIERGKDWYANAFGVRPYFDEPFYVGFNIGGYELGLDPHAGASGAGGSTGYWGVDNADVAFAHMIASGATAASPVTETGDGIKVAVVLDPFGNRVGIIENPHFDVSTAT